MDETENLAHSKHIYDIFFHQNLQECLSNSDIHLYNPNSKDNKYDFLTEQILKYIALILHPGLVTPTHIERCMQTAYVAKLNSGCLSRQVGAVITDENYSIKAVGWNEVPEGQVSCNLRCIPNYCNNRDQESFSAFELEDATFQNAIGMISQNVDSTTFGGVPMAYCFKDIYNEIKHTKNQVYTRALHAEENAFLQLSKYGGQGIRGGKLFSTASPCELCAKKAYQLGIKEIVYIDPYPGISIHHILTFGKSNPKTISFFGAIGDAFIRLYTPRMPLKDELHLICGQSFKSALSKNVEANIDTNSYRILDQSNRFVFKSRNDISETTVERIEVIADSMDRFCHQMYWTGSSFDGFKLISCNKTHSFVCSDKDEMPYSATVLFDPPLSKGDIFEIEIEASVKDTRHIMNPYYAHLISKKIDSLCLSVEAPPSIIDHVEQVVYADLNMSKNLEVSREEVLTSNEGKTNIYTFKIEKPNLMYTYCLEWKFDN